MSACTKKATVSAVSTSAALSHIWLANFHKTAPIMATFMTPIMALIMKFFLRFLAMGTILERLLSECVS